MIWGAGRLRLLRKFVYPAGDTRWKFPNQLCLSFHRLQILSILGTRRKEVRKPKNVTKRREKHHVVEKRNARERQRVQTVNSAFVRLRKAIPTENPRGKRISKVKTLQKAIAYIRGLEKLLEEDDYYQSGYIQVSLKLISRVMFYTRCFYFLGWFRSCSPWSIFFIEPWS